MTDEIKECQRCGKPAYKDVVHVYSLGSDEPTRSDNVWICEEGHTNYYL